MVLRLAGCKTVVDALLLDAASAQARRGGGAMARHVSAPLLWRRASGPGGAAATARGLALEILCIQTPDYGRIHPRPVLIGRRHRGLVRCRQELGGAREHLYSEAHFSAKARSGPGHGGRAMSVSSGAPVIQRRLGDAERGGAGAGFGERRCGLAGLPGSPRLARRRG